MFFFALTWPKFPQEEAPAVVSWVDPLGPASFLSSIQPIHSIWIIGRTSHHFIIVLIISNEIFYKDLGVATIDLITSSGEH